MKKHSWQIRKYKGDLALYAHCKCGFEYVCSTNKRNEDGTFSFEQEITILYNYCPICGCHKKHYNEIPIKMDGLQWEKEEDEE